MEQKRNKKIIFQYVIGVLLLSVSVVLAWFVPGWYANWQDRLLFDRMILSSREDIEFLNVDSLDMEGRLKLLKEAEYLSWTGEVKGEDDYENSYDTLAVYEHLEVFRKILGQWTDAGLLPELFDTTAPFEEFYSQVYIMDYAVTSVDLGQVTLPVCVFALADDTLEVNMLVIMDEEKEIVYYMSVGGHTVREYMAKLLGYENLEHMVWQVLEDKRIGQQEDYSKYDFAGISGANSAVITGTPEELNFDVKLEFDNFIGYAQRRVVGRPGEYGISIALGTNKWNSFINETLIDTEMYEWPASTTEWQEALVKKIFSVEQEGIAYDVYSGEIYGVDGDSMVQEETTAAVEKIY